MPRVRRVFVNEGGGGALIFVLFFPLSLFLSCTSYAQKYRSTIPFQKFGFTKMAGLAMAMSDTFNVTHQASDVVLEPLIAAVADPEQRAALFAEVWGQALSFPGDLGMAEGSPCCVRFRPSASRLTSLRS